MNSSYKSTLNFGDLIFLIIKLYNPRKIIEFGILDGFSLKIFADNIKNGYIEAYDIFEDFNGNSANKEKIEKLFINYNNVKIKKGDFYKSLNNFDNNSVDLIHIDIANNGDVYEFAINNYISKLTLNGLLILEGGSNERDNIEWMIKYNKKKIQPVLDKYKNIYNIIVIDKFPSITIITKK